VPGPSGDSGSWGGWTALRKTYSPSGLHVFNHISKRGRVVFRILPSVEGLQGRLKLFSKLLEAAFALSKEAHGFSHQIRLGLVFPSGELLVDKIFKISG